MERRINIKFMVNVPKDLGITIGESSIKIEYCEDENNRCVVKDNNTDKDDNTKDLRNETFSSNMSSMNCDSVTTENREKHEENNSESQLLAPTSARIPAPGEDTIEKTTNIGIKGNVVSEEEMEQLLGKIKLCPKGRQAKMDDYRFNLLTETMRMFRATRDGRLLDAWGYKNYNSFQNAYYVHKSKRKQAESEK